MEIDEHRILTTEVPMEAPSMPQPRGTSYIGWTFLLVTMPCFILLYEVIDGATHNNIINMDAVNPYILLAVASLFVPFIVGVLTGRRRI